MWSYDPLLYCNNSMSYCLYLSEESEDTHENEERSYGSYMLERLTGSEEGRVDHVLQVCTKFLVLTHGLPITMFLRPYMAVVYCLFPYKLLWEVCTCFYLVCILLHIFVLLLSILSRNLSHYCVVACINNG